MHEPTNNKTQSCDLTALWGLLFLFAYHTKPTQASTLKGQHDLGSTVDETIQKKNKPVSLY